MAEGGQESRGCELKVCGCVGVRVVGGGFSGKVKVGKPDVAPGR